MQLKTNMKSYFSMNNLLPVFLVVLGLNFTLQQMKGSEFYVKNKKNRIYCQTAAVTDSQLRLHADYCE